MTGQRLTRQRRALLAELGALPGFISAQALHARLAEQGQAISLATVYRNLQWLTGQGLLDVINHDGGEATYRACHQAVHHHHVVCRSCGAAVEVEAQAVEAWAEQVANAAGFSEVQHTVEITGLCPTCATVRRE